MINISRLIIAAIIAALFIFGFASCGSSEDEPGTEAQSINLGSGEPTEAPTEAPTGETPSDGATEAPTQGQPGDEASVPDPTLTVPTLTGLTVPLNATIKLSTVSAPLAGDCNTVRMTSGDIATGSLILVNAAHPLTADPADADLLLTLFENRGKTAAGKQTYKLRNNTMKLQEDALNAFNALAARYYSAKSNDYILVSGAYRDEQTQAELFQSALVTYGTKEVTKYAQKSNCSDFRTGLSLDLKYMPEDGKTYTLGDATAKAAKDFLASDAAESGFIVRYPSGKSAYTGIAKNIQPYQYRFVGTPHALIIDEGGYCLEEYIAGIKNYTDTYLKLEFGTSIYYIYYVPATIDGDTMINVPKTYTAEQYSISGNNVDGFIVTVKAQ